MFTGCMHMMRLRAAATQAKATTALGPLALPVEVAHRVRVRR